MAIKVACPNCDKTYNLADSFSGKQVRCTSCNNPFTVKEVDEEEAAVVVEEVVAADGDNLPPRRSVPVPARAKRPAHDEEEDDRPRRRKQSRDEEDEEASRPRKKQKAKSGNGLMIGLIAGGAGLLLLIGGVVLCICLLGGSKFTVENFKKVKQGMTEKEVVDLLGSPTQTLDVGFTKTLTWRNNEGHYSVVFMNGTVTATLGLGMKDGGMALNLGGGGGPNIQMPNIQMPNIQMPNIQMPNQPKVDWNKIQKGMTEQQVIALAGQPVHSHDYEDIHVIHANVTVDEVKGPNGKTRPVRALHYFKGFGEMGFVDVTLVDGKVYKVVQK